MGWYPTMPTVVPTIKRLSLSLGITVGLGFAFVPQEGCGGVQPASDMPERLAGPIRGCAVEHTPHVGDGEHTVKYEVLLDSNGQVTAIALIESTVGDEELEKCIASSIRSLTVNDLLSHRSENFDREVARSESRNLLGNPALPIAACLASPPCLLALTVLAGATYITVNIVVHSATATSTAIPTTITTAWPMATAKPTATTTAPPVPIGLTREESCPPCKTVSGRIVPLGTISYRPLDTPDKPQHGIVGPHYNLYKANQAPRNAPQPCKCFWQPIGAVAPADLPADAIPIEPFANPGG
jgi:hypothetical protein